MAETARYRYSTNRGSVFYAETDSHPALSVIRGPAPTGALTEELTLKLSKSNLEVGGKPRSAMLRRSIGTEDPNNCVQDAVGAVKHVVVMTDAHVATLVPGVTSVSVRGETYVYVGMSPERMK